MPYETRGWAPEVEQLVAVVQERHIGRAAERLGIPQPTLSRSMVRLSETLGVPLLRRDGRGVIPTRYAETLSLHAERALAELIAGVRRTRNEVNPRTGTVVFGFLHSLGPVTVPTLLTRFATSSPGVRVALVQDSTHTLLAQVRRGTIDLCLAAPITADLPTDLASKVWARQRLVAVVAADHPWVSRSRVSVQRLLGEQLITMRPGYGLRSFTDSLFESAQRPPTYTFESHDIATAVGLAAAGLGVSILPEGSAAGAAREVTISDHRAHRDIRLFWTADLPSVPARALHDEILAVGHGNDDLSAPGRHP
jgi:LysR family transcriptional regulator, transcription activator of glutamate synthase operon